MPPTCSSSASGTSFPTVSLLPSLWSCLCTSALPVEALFPWVVLPLHCSCSWGVLTSSEAGKKGPVLFLPIPKTSFSPHLMLTASFQSAQGHPPLPAAPSLPPSQPTSAQAIPPLASLSPRPGPVPLLSLSQDYEPTSMPVSQLRAGISSTLRTSVGPAIASSATENLQSGVVKGARTWAKPRQPRLVYLFSPQILPNHLPSPFQPLKLRLKMQVCSGLLERVSSKTWELATAAGICGPDRLGGAWACPGGAPFHRKENRTTLKRPPLPLA